MSEGLQIWLDPEKYGSLRPLWQDSYIWSPVAVDESLPLHQTSFLDIDEDQAKEAVEERRKSDSAVLDAQQQQNQNQKNNLLREPTMAGHRRDPSWDEDARTLSPGEDYYEEDQKRHAKGARSGSQDRPTRYTGIKSDRKSSSPEERSSNTRPVSYPPAPPKPGMGKRMKSFHLMKDRDDQDASLNRRSSASTRRPSSTPRTIPEPELQEPHSDYDDDDSEPEPLAARVPRRRRTRRALPNIHEGQPMASSASPDKGDYFRQAPPAKAKEVEDDASKPRRRKQTAPSSQPTSSASSSSSSLPLQSSTSSSSKQPKPAPALEKSKSTRVSSKRDPGAPTTTKVPRGAAVIPPPPLKPSTSTSVIPTVTSAQALAPVAKPKKKKRSADPLPPLGVMAPMPSGLARPSTVTAPATPNAGSVQRARDDSKLTVRLDLNLDIEVELKAKIEGDLTLTLFE